MCEIMTTRAFLSPSSASCVAVDVAGSRVVVGTRPSGCTEFFPLRRQCCPTSSSSRGQCQLQFRHNWTTSCDRSKIRPRSRDHCNLIRASVFGADLSYELADQLNAWIVPAPPEPVQFPRKNLNMKFAVLLMRSAYEAVDDLDFVPMNKFQQKFWKLRQSELEPYTLQHKPLKVKYGDLTDPLYFDFISFSQFATISQEIQKGELVFQEKIGASGETQTVRRDASLGDNSELPSNFIKRAGDLIYERLLEGFEDKSFNAPPPLPEESNVDAVVQGVQTLLQILVDQGYALKAVVDRVESSSNSLGGKFRVRMDGVATLWGVQALVSRRAVVIPTFDALAVGGFLRACKRNATFKIRYTDTFVEELWTVT